MTYLRTGTVALVLCLCALQANGQWFGPAEPRITQVEYLWNPGRLVVRVEARGREPYLIAAASAAFRDPYTRRRIVMGVRRDQVGVVPNGDVHQLQFAFDSLPLAPPYEFVIKLWTTLVESPECNRGPSGSCPDCEKNGFHLEGEVASTGWIHVQPGIDPPGAWNRRTF